MNPRQWLPAIWYGPNRPPAWLRWLSAPYALYQATRPQPDRHPPLPVIVVGNLTAGGTGKTPLVVHLVRLFTARGIRTGVISRGYGGRRARAARRVRPARDTAARVGDEPLLIARLTGAPVWVCTARRRALNAALEAGMQLVISDDGLQHTALPRSVEICVIDGRRRFGNGHLLPAGPLRQHPRRLETVDFIVARDGPPEPGEWPMTVEPVEIRRLDNNARLPSDHFHGQSVDAVAGIADPERFFEALEQLGCRVRRHPLADHQPLDPAWLAGLAGPVVMTEKDAARLPPGTTAAHWHTLVVQARLPARFDSALLQQVVL